MFLLTYTLTLFDHDSNLYSNTMFQPIFITLLIRATWALTIPAPSGPYAVSLSTTDITNHGYLDPYAPPSNPHDRRVIFSTFTPVDVSNTPCQNTSSVPYMTPATASYYDGMAAELGLSDGLFSSLEMEFCVTSRHRCKPHNLLSHPLILFSPGLGSSRLLYSAIAREIASHGYVVVTIDHSYEGPVVELPAGTVYKAVEIDADNSTVIETVTRLRAKDYSFVLSHFIQNPVPGINLNHVFGTGHSLGGATAAVAMASDKRIIGGVNFDGLIANPALDSGLDQPFFLAGRQEHEDTDATWNIFYDNLRGSKALLAITGATHSTFTDIPTLLGALGDALPSEAIPGLKTVFGSLLFSKAAPIMAEIVQAVVDLATHGKVRSMLTGGDAKLPEVVVVRSGI